MIFKKHAASIRKSVQPAVLTAVLLVILAGCPLNPFFGLEPSPRDEVGPEVTVINPTADQIVSGSLVFTGITEDKYAVKSVSIGIDSATPQKLDGTYNWYHVVDTGSIGEGAHSATIIAKDQFGNSSETVTNFTVDQEVPNVNHDLSYDAFENYIRGTNQEITGTAADDNGVARVQISLDGGVSFSDAALAPSGTSWSYTIADTATLKPGDGYIDAVLRVIDSSGLIGTTNFPLWVDNTAPTISISQPTGNTTIDASEELIGNNLEITGAADDTLTDGLLSVDVTVGATIGPLAATLDSGSYSKSVDVSAIVDGGPVTVTATATDKAGNRSSASVNVVLDDNPPSFDDVLATTERGTLDSDLTKTSNNFASGTFTLTGSVAVGPTDTMADLASIRVKLEPAAGGTALFDTAVTPPVNEPGDFSHTFTTAGIPDGAYTLSFTVTNNRGGFAVEERSITVDKSGATATVDDPAAGTAVAGTDVAVSGLARPNVADVSSIRIEIGDGATGADGVIVDSSYSAPGFTGARFSYVGDYYTYSWDTTAAGFDTGEEPRITVTVTDVAGNITSDTITVLLDPDAPTIGFDSYDHPTNTAYSGKPLASGRYVHGSGTLHGTAVDNSSVESVEISVDGGSFVDSGAAAGASVSWSYTLGGLSEGTHSVVARVTDDSVPSNINTTSIQIEVDNTSPALSGLTAALTDGSGTAYLHGDVEVSGSAQDAAAGVESVALTVEEPSSVGAPSDGPESLVWDGFQSFSAAWDTGTLPTNAGSPVVAADGITLGAAVTDAAGNKLEASSLVNVRPYISSLGSYSAYLGESGLTIAGDNFTHAAGADPVVTVGGGDVAIGIGAVTASGPSSITFGLDDDYPPKNELSSGPVLVSYNGVSNAAQTAVKMDIFALNALAAQDMFYPDAVYNGSRIAAAFSAKQGNSRYVYYSGSAGDVLIADGNDGGNGQFQFTRIAYDGTNSRTWVSYVRGAGVRVATSTAEFSGFTVNNAVTATPPAASSATYNDLAVDDDGNGQLVYYDGGALYHTESTDGGATFSAPVMIDGASSDAGAWVALAVEPVGAGADRLHAAYHDATAGALKYAYFDGSAWSAPRTVDGTSAGDFGNGIAVDSQGGIHISYYNGNDGDLKYAYASGPAGSFATQVVDSSGLTGWFSSIALDGADNPHITYANFTTGKPSYARYSGGAFEAVTIAEPGTYNINANSNSTATVIDGSGDVHMIYDISTELKDAVYLPEN